MDEIAKTARDVFFEKNAKIQSQRKEQEIARKIKEQELLENALKKQLKERIEKRGTTNMDGLVGLSEIFGRLNNQVAGNHFSSRIQSTSKRFKISHWSDLLRVIERYHIGLDTSKEARVLTARAESFFNSELDHVVGLIYESQTLREAKLQQEKIYNLLCEVGESPIEKQFLSAFLIEACHSSNVIVRVLSISDRRMDHATEVNRFVFLQSGAKETFVVSPQEQYGGYIVDFEISRDTEESSNVVIIECDGHDFHEKTKEQAIHDKQRDRFFQQRNVPLLRYSGSEIYNSPNLIAQEVLSFLRGTTDNGDRP